MIQVHEIKLSLDENEDLLTVKLARKLRIDPHDIIACRILRKSLDARKELCFSYSLAAQVKNEKKVLKLPFVTEYKEPDLSVQPVVSDERVAVIGYGPAGIFAALRLCEAGVKPIVFERGKRIKERAADVERFFKEGKLDPSSNIQFGEGGAGTFSDAKLTTRVKSGWIPYILHKFVEFGAPEEIAWEAHPHIGTDRIRVVITAITDWLIAQGAEFHFSAQVKDFVIENGRVRELVTDQGSYPVDRVIFAAGHSAYDTVCVLQNKGITILPKDFAVGFRVEHPQRMIDDVQYSGRRHPKLPPSEYFLTHTSSEGYGVYSFCMCPGGYVVPAVSEPETIVTNGMSYAARDNHLANAAILCQVRHKDLPGDELSGFAYLHELERKAYALSGSYRALSMNVKDYVNGTESEPVLTSSYVFGTEQRDLRSFYGEKMEAAFREAFLDFDRKIPGFIEKGLLVGPETRSSSPVRIPRNQELHSEQIVNFYPCGEGSGYGGGIVSCASDGVKVAESILQDLREQHQ